MQEIKADPDSISKKRLLKSTLGLTELMRGLKIKLEKGK